jgi:enterochelin esterase-like enzyme
MRLVRAAAACLALVLLSACGQQLPLPGPPAPAPPPAPPAKDVHKPPDLLLAEQGAQPTSTPAPASPGARATAVPTPSPTPRAVASGTPVRVSRPLAGSLLDDHFYSPIIGQEFTYRIYLPAAYASERSRRFPVLYMLHGAGGDYTEWSDSFLPEVVDLLIAKDEIQPLIVVMPNSGNQDGPTYWANWEEGGPRWADYVAEDVVRTIDSRYRTQPRADSRAIGGLSMGGTGALALALSHPEEFGVVGGHSPSIRVEPDPALWFITGGSFDEQNPLWLAENRAEAGSRLRMWLDVGEDDVWRPNVETLHAALVQHGFNVAWQELPGEHEAQYWIEHLPDYLRWYAGALAEPTP